MMEKTKQTSKAGLVLLGIVIGTIIGYFWFYVPQQSRIEELTDEYNALMDQYNGLMDQYNALVSKHNDMIREINALSDKVNKAIENYNKQNFLLRDPQKLLNEIYDALNWFFARV